MYSMNLSALMLFLTLKTITPRSGALRLSHAVASLSGIRFVIKQAAMPLKLLATSLTNFWLLALLILVPRTLYLV